MEEYRVIQATHLRDVVGNKVSCVFYHLLPTLSRPKARRNDNLWLYYIPEGSLLSMKVKNKTVRSQKWEKGDTFSHRQSRALYVVLTRNLGLTKASAKILINRGKLHLSRIEGVISGIADAMLCADPFIFNIENVENWGILKDLCRKVFQVGITNLDLLVDSWKEWTRWLFHQHAKTDVIGELVKPAKNNIYVRLNKLSQIQELKDDFFSFQKLSHIISTRQFPYMGKRREEKSLKRFEEVVTSIHNVSDLHHCEMASAAFYIGRYCRRYPRYRNASHFSINSSGDFHFTIGEGGNAVATRTLAIQVLNRRPTEEVEDTPWGILHHNQNMEIWRYLFRPEPITEGEFLKPMVSGFPKEQPHRYYGLDEHFGKQLLYAAWKVKESIPKVRVSTVPEMGNKARIVTIGPAWLQIIQAPLAHQLKVMVFNHPSTFSSFHRQDQAWMGATMLARSKVKEFHHVLSSDLKDATNAQSISLTKSILLSFMKGYGLPITPYIMTVMDLIGPREIIFPDGHSCTSRRGIMMGEPMAKPSLTLLNLCIDFCAWRKYKIFKDRKNLQRRCFHIAGDDHLAAGPKEYLDLLTQYHLRSGSQIEGGVHGTSQIAVRYVERVLYVRNFNGRKVHDEQHYEQSMIVDGIKVRVLERGHLTTLLKDNKNVAIGKSNWLATTLKWKPKHKYWPNWHLFMIRDLFIRRMGTFLPNARKRPRSFNGILLPRQLGGYGLAINYDEEHIALTCCSPPIRWVVNAFRENHPKWREGVKALKRLNTNLAKRGDPQSIKFEQDIIEQLQMVYPEGERLSWEQIMEKFPSFHGARGTIHKALLGGYCSLTHFAEMCTRGVTFQNLLTDPKKISIFNTQSYSKTMSQLYVDLAKLGLDSCGDDVPDFQTYLKIRDKLNPDWFFPFREETTADIGYWDPDNPDAETWEFIDTTYEKLYTMKLPTLTLPDTFLYQARKEYHYTAEEDIPLDYVDVSDAESMVSQSDSPMDDPYHKVESRARK
nr:TPA_asm: RNA-dependent RNA polymerase [Matryoshka RNA virus 3]